MGFVWKLWLILALLAFPVMATGQTLRIVVAESTAPFAPLVEAVVRDAGFTPVMSYVPQARLRGVLSEYDAAFFVTAEAISLVPGMTKVPLSLALDEFVAVTVDPGLRVTTLADLRGYRVGIVRGSMIAARATEGLQDLTSVDTPEMLLRMLAAKRFDVALLHRELVKISAGSAAVATYYVQIPPLLTVPLYFALSETGAAYKPRLTRAFKTVVSDGS